ncbi:MAG: hypothetical protein KC620_16605, partial [Myxococcales bacterium]|nr:hypothetical protein [Myxococcales bacterium]
RLLARTWLYRVAFRLGPLFVPLDLQTYLRVHFEKVGPQTREMLRRYAERAEAQGTLAPALRALTEQLPAPPGH